MAALTVSVRAVSLVVAAFAVVGVRSARATGEYVDDLSSTDRAELNALERAHPEAVRAFRDGEAALRGGDLARAERLFAQSREALPRFGLPARRQCQVLVDLGRRDEALAACRAAVAYSASGRDLRATVAALMAGPAAPTTEDFANASIFANGVIRETILGHAARFDIARRLQDRAMMKDAARHLELLAPDHYETRRARADLARHRPWASWFLLALAALTALGTLIHARRRRRPPAMLARAVSTAALVVGLAAAMLGAPPARAADPVTPLTPGGATSLPITSDTFRVNDADPTAHIPSEGARNKNPIEFGYFLQDLLERGAKAMKSNQPLVAARYYEAVAKAVPTMATGFSELCGAYEVSGRREQALAACTAAMARQGARLEDYVRYIRLTMAKPGPLGAAELTALDAVFAHLDQADDVSKLTGNQMACDLALRLSDRARLERCTTALVKLAPNNARTVTYEWALAMQKGDAAAARRLLDEGRQAGIDAEGLRRMEAAVASAGPSWAALLRGWPAVSVLALVAAAAAMMLTRRRRASA